MKKCTKCGVEFPANEKHFFKKTIKNKLASGEIATYYSLRAICKKCHAINMKEAHRKRRCKELGCKKDDYQSAWVNRMSYNKLKIKSLENIDKELRSRILNEINRYGYEFTSISDYHKHIERKRYNWRIVTGKRVRKYDYGHNDLLTLKERNDMYIKLQTDARLAQQMGLSVDDAPKELIETKRLIIKLKRELGLTHSTKTK